MTLTAKFAAAVLALTTTVPLTASAHGMRYPFSGRYEWRTVSRWVPAHNESAWVPERCMQRGWRTRCFGGYWGARYVPGYYAPVHERVYIPFAPPLPARYGY